jgi:ADP-heptose:LPS heptosyltransferase
MKKILVVSTTGMGDCLWGTPALRALKKSFPDSDLHFLINPQWKNLFLGNPNLDQIIPYSPKWFKQPLIGLKLFRTRYDHVLIFHANKDIKRLLPWLRYRSLLAHQKSSWISEKNRVPTEGAVHGIQRRLFLISEIGAKPDGGQMEIFFNDKDQLENRDFMTKREISAKEFIYLNVGASVLHKRWGIEQFTALADKILETTSYKIVVGGGPEEKQLMESIKTRLDPERTICTYDRPIRSNAFLIGQSRLLVTTDTGPMHIGFALKIPTIALFGPTDPQASGPFEIENNLCQLILPHFDSSSPIEKSNRESDCFNLITVPMVWDKVQEALKK